MLRYVMLLPDRQRSEPKKWRRVVLVITALCYFLDIFQQNLMIKCIFIVYRFVEFYAEICAHCCMKH